MSFTFHPEHMRTRTPGQVPRLDPALDRTLELPPVYLLDRDIAAGVPAKPIMRASAIASDLGLPRGAELSLTGLMKTLSQGSANEVDFRRGVMAHLIAERYEPALRRALMSRALSFFRSSHPSSSTTVATQVVRASHLPTARTDGRYTIRDRSQIAPVHEKEETQKAARGGKYHRRVPVTIAGENGEPKTTYKYVYDEASYRRMPEAHVDGKSAKEAYLQSAVARILDKAGDDCDPNVFSELVHRHGAKAIAGVLASVGATHANGRVRRTAKKSVVSAHVACFGIEYEESLWKAAAFGLLPFADASSLADANESALMKADPEQLPSTSPSAAPPTAGGGGPSPKKLPPGTRRIWHNRIVERGADDKWHVVGHVAGLEDPGKVEPLAPHEIDPEHLKELIAKIKALLSHEKKKQDIIHAPIPGPSASESAEKEPKPKTKTQKQKQKTETKTETKTEP